MSEFTNPNEYQKEADRTKCNQIDALDRLNECPHFIQVARMSLLHGIIGLTGELGELAGIVERWLWYGQDFDRENFIEELGDSQWYNAELHNALDVSMLEVMRANIRKLRARYPEKFDQELAKEENRNREEEMKAAIKEIKTGPITSRVIKTSEEWEEYFDAHVLDPDGWRVRAGEPNGPAWSLDPICKEEFAARWYLSTCKQPPKGELKEMVDVLGKRGFKSIGEAIVILQSRDNGKEELDKELHNQELYLSGCISPAMYEQTGQGFAEPPEELPPETFFTKEQIDKAVEGQDSFAMKDFEGFPSALESEDFRRLGGCECHGANFCPDQEFSHYEDDVPVFKSKTKPPEEKEPSIDKVCENMKVMDLKIPEPLPRFVSNPVDPPYIYGKSREVRTGEDKQPEDGWTVARKIATTFVDGQNLAYALKSIDSFEEQWKKEHRLRTKKLGQLIFESLYDKQFCHGDLEGREIQQYEKAAAKLLELRAVYVDLGEQQRLALTGKLAIAALGLDPNETSPQDVADEIYGLKSNAS